MDENLICAEDKSIRERASASAFAAASAPAMDPGV